MANKLRAGRLPAIFYAVGPKVRGLLGSKAFFYTIFGLFLFQSLWIALSSRYPQAFDENYHFGLIQLHASQWLPYFTAHPYSASLYGPVSRDPSYFFHFLLSLPYRLISHFTGSLAVQVIVLRLINTAFFGWGLFVYRKVLRELAVSIRLQNTVFLFFVLTPVVPQLASQINYDNLLFPLVGLLLLYMLRLIRMVRERQLIDVQLVIQILLIGMLAGIVTYASLPLFVAVSVAIVVVVLRVFRHQANFWSKAVLHMPARRTIFIVYALLCVVIGGLFIERYGINLVRYHNPVPDCAAVLSEERCESYAPWARDHEFARINPKPNPLGIAVYPFVWVHRIVFETMFIISSRFDNDGTTVVYIPAPPITVANYTAWTIVITGSVLTGYFTRRWWGHTDMRLLLLAISFFIAVLMLKNFTMYLRTGEGVAIHGRYLVPIYPILYFVLACSFSWFLDRFRRPSLKPWLVIVTLVFFLQGAGLIGWIFRSDPSWYWSRAADAPVYQINRPLQNIVHRVFIP